MSPPPSAPQDPPQLHASPHFCYPNPLKYGNCMIFSKDKCKILFNLDEVGCTVIPVLGRWRQENPWSWLASQLGDLVGSMEPVRDTVSINRVGGLESWLSRGPLAEDLGLGPCTYMVASNLSVTSVPGDCPLLTLGSLHDKGTLAFLQRPLTLMKTKKSSD